MQMRRMLRMARAEQRKTSQLRRVWLFLKSSHGKLILILRRYVRFHEVGRLWGTGSVTKNMKLFLLLPYVTFLSHILFLFLPLSHFFYPLLFLLSLFNIFSLSIHLYWKILSFLMLPSCLLKNSFLHVPFLFTEKFFHFTGVENDL